MRVFCPELILFGLLLTQVSVEDGLHRTVWSEKSYFYQRRINNNSLREPSYGGLNGVLFPFKPHGCTLL